MPTRRVVRGSSPLAVKICSRCEEHLPLSSFGVQRRNHTLASGEQKTYEYPSSYCRPCSVDYSREYYTAHREEKWRYDHNRHLKRFGITAEDYASMLDAQGGCCALCPATAADERGHRLHVDHDHATGAVRGLLCGSCNRGIGYFGDDPVRLLKAADYLLQLREEVSA